MFLDFFLLLKNDGIPVSLKEYLDLLEGLEKGVVEYNVEDFYFLCKASMVKHEQHLDRFDVLFGKYFEGLETINTEEFMKIPEEWLRREKMKMLTEEEKALIKKMGGLDKLMERLKQLMKEQKERHEGGNRWIGTGGTSPFGNSGYNPEGIRIGGEGGNRSAMKVWEKRQYKNLDDAVELDTRNMKMALRRLRALTREGLPDELDLDKTIRKTSENAGYLDLQMVPQKRNNIKVLLLLDIGGSMDDHIEICARLFSAAKYEFKHIESFYFHNCLYESVWKDNVRRWSESTPTLEVLHTYNSDYKVIFVGDASMGTYEITHAGGSVEHWNDEPGLVWLRRMKDHFKDMVWLNPIPPEYWDFTPSIGLLKKEFQNKMFPLTLAGLDDAVKALKNRKKKWD
ncbi:MAG: VWA domain-containing protein [Bacteroidia bacterium]|nr:VWA domain-containing protein [Bacteroidia bacterium]